MILILQAGKKAGMHDRMYTHTSSWHCIIPGKPFHDYFWRHSDWRKIAITINKCPIPAENKKQGSDIFSTIFYVPSRPIRFRETVPSRWVRILRHGT